MIIKPDFLTLIKEQDGFFTTAQAKLYNQTSRQSLSASVKSDYLERIQSGIYKVNMFPESLQSEVIIAGLTMGDRGAISCMSAMAYHNLSDEQSYDMQVTPIDPYRNRDLRAIQATFKSVAGMPLLDSECIKLGQVCITSVERTVFDCVMLNLIQIESIASIIDSGEFNDLLLTEQQREMWEDHPSVHASKAYAIGSAFQ